MMITFHFHQSNLLTTKRLADHEDSNALVDTVNEQNKGQISRLFEALNIDESNLTHSPL